MLTDGHSTWRLAVVEGALEVLPYRGPQSASNLLLHDRTTDTTFFVSLTAEDALTWTQAASGAGPAVEALPLTDEVTGTPHQLAIVNGALTY